MYSIAQEKGKNYCNYFNYVLKLTDDSSDMLAQCTYVPQGKMVEALKVAFRKGQDYYIYSDFEQIERKHFCNSDSTNLVVKLSDPKIGECTVTYCLKRDGIYITTDVGESGFVAEITGEVSFGSNDNVSAVCMETLGSELRSSYGPATSKIDDALFDRVTDSALRITSEDECRIRYEYDKKKYCFMAQKQLRIWVEEQVLASRFYVNYKPINKKNTFPTPPAGWMTWYAVKFNACEQVVLENAEKQKELFAEYGANTIWVDWEWCHKMFKDKNPSLEIDFFHPDAERYPHGLKCVAEKIKEKGFIPALWVGPTVENIFTDFVKEHENSLYADVQTWCSRYFYDLTNEAYLKEYIPKAFEKVKNDGFEAVKWDCLPTTLEIADNFQDYFADSNLTPEQALRNVIKAARNVLGEDYYMMSCAGGWDRVVLFAADVFDGARIGEDIFSWNDFIENFMKRIMRLYPLHNNLFYCDPDNLVVRPEHNNYEQAVSRTSLFALLGLPLTLGDDLRELPEDRVELIRRALPPLDIRPMNLTERSLNDIKVITNLQISKSFEEWNVVGITNLADDVQKIKLDFDKDLHLDKGEYLVYDYWNHEFVGKISDEMTVELKPFETAVYSIRRYTGKVQIVSTSRHISQGGLELVDVWNDGEGNLHGISKVVKNEPYIITYYEPKRKQLMEKVICSEKTCEVEWII